VIKNHPLDIFPRYPGSQRKGTSQSAKKWKKVARGEEKTPLEWGGGEFRVLEVRT